MNVPPNENITGAVQDAKGAFGLASLGQRKAFQYEPFILSP